MRGLTILSAYIAAVLTGSLALLFLFARHEEMASWPMGSVAVFIAVASLIGGALSAPLALPVVIYSEKKRRGYWWVFLLAGILAGVIASAVYLQSFHFLTAGIAALPSAAAGLVYWLIAWKLFPPKNSTQVSE